MWNGIKRLLGKREMGKEYDSIIELLKKDYLSKTKDELKQKTAKIEQDFISQGLTNDQGLASSTYCIDQQLKVHFEYNNKLIDYIIKSLEQEFAHIPLENFQNKLLTTTQEEYKKLFSVSGKYLVRTGLASERSIKRHKQQINREMAKTKTRIEIQCAIHSKKQNKGSVVKTSKPLRKKVWPYIIGALTFLATILAILWYTIDLKQKFFPPALSIPNSPSNSHPSITPSRPNSPLALNYDSPESKIKVKQPIVFHVPMSQSKTDQDVFKMVQASIPNLFSTDARNFLLNTYKSSGYSITVSQLALITTDMWSADILMTIQGISPNIVNDGNSDNLKILIGRMDSEDAEKALAILMRTRKTGQPSDANN